MGVDLYDLVHEVDNVICFTMLFTLWSYYYSDFGFVTHSGVIVKLPSNKD